MAKALLYRWFGVGAVPESERAAFEEKGIVLLDEGLRGSMTFRNYRAPGRRSWWRKVGMVGSVVVTKDRLAAFAFSQPIVYVLLAHERFAKLEITAEKAQVLCIAFDASDFSEAHSGRVECRFRTPLASQFEERLP